METKDAVSHLQNRLSKAMSSRISWSLNDRAAVSKLCIEAAEHPLHDDLADPYPCDYCGGPEYHKKNCIGFL